MLELVVALWSGLLVALGMHAWRLRQEHREERAYQAFLRWQEAEDEALRIDWLRHLREHEEP